MKIAFSKPDIGDQEVLAVNSVLTSGWLASGEQTALFEQEFSQYVGVKYAIFTNSCTSALKMSYKWLKENDSNAYIHYPENTFCATYSAAIEMGLKAFPRASDNSTLNGENEWLSEYRVNMHYGGIKDSIPCLIEDSAHRIEPNDMMVGKIRCYSFYATKNMTTGSGGMLVTNDEEIYERCRLFWRDGLTTSTADRLSGIPNYEVRAMAGGYDGNDIAASIGRVQLTRLPQFTERRNNIVGYYNSGLEQQWHGNHLYPYFVKDEAQVYDCISFLKTKGIAAGYHYPGTGWNGVSLPLYPLLTDSEVEYIISSVKEYAKGI